MILLSSSFLFLLDNFSKAFHWKIDLKFVYKTVILFRLMQTYIVRKFVKFCYHFCMNLLLKSFLFHIFKWLIDENNNIIIIIIIIIIKWYLLRNHNNNLNIHVYYFSLLHSRFKMILITFRITSDNGLTDLDLRKLVIMLIFLILKVSDCFRLYAIASDIC